MRGIYTSVNDLRRKVFREVAKLSYAYPDVDMQHMNKIPYEIIPGQMSNYRESVFLERAIIRERMRLAMGLPVRTMDEHSNVTAGVEAALKPETYYQPPLVNVIPFACNGCPDNVITITNICQHCIAHPCAEVCPKDAITFTKHGSEIDQSKCIKCGKCMEACQYNAIVRQERPCAKVCGMKAIKSDEYGRAAIDQDKCVSCGQCLANCPFGAIADKAQIFQAIQAIKNPETPVYAAIAPAVTGQFGPDLKPEQIPAAFKALGFEDVMEVAIGADLCTLSEARDFLEEVPEKQPFMATSCCPAWSMMAHKLFPTQAECISMALTPMVLTGRLLKKLHPGCKVAFIGPCSAKKLEAMRTSIRSDIDFVLTYEEVGGMFEARNVDFKALPMGDTMHGASGDARSFAVSGGVAQAVANCIKEWNPEADVKIQKAEGLDECRKMLTMAKAGKLNGYLLEGMACPGGCVAGAGTLQPIKKTSAAIAVHAKVSTNQHANASNYKNLLDLLEEKDLQAPE